MTGRAGFKQEMRNEFRSHTDSYAEDLIAAGVPIEEAHRSALLAFGALPVIEEECRQSRGLRWFDELRRNLLDAVRVLRGSPSLP